MRRQLPHGGSVTSVTMRAGSARTAWGDVGVDAQGGAVIKNPGMPGSPTFEQVARLSLRADLIKYGGYVLMILATTLPLLIVEMAIASIAGKSTTFIATLQLTAGLTVAVPTGIVALAARRKLKGQQAELIRLREDNEGLRQENEDLRHNLTGSK